MLDNCINIFEKFIEDFINLSFKFYFEVVYVVINFYVFKYIFDDICWFGFVYGYWLFLYEWVNKVFKLIKISGLF